MDAAIEFEAYRERALATINAAALRPPFGVPPWQQRSRRFKVADDDFNRAIDADILLKEIAPDQVQVVAGLFNRD